MKFSIIPIELEINWDLVIFQEFYLESEFSGNCVKAKSENFLVSKICANSLDNFYCNDEVRQFTTIEKAREYVKQQLTQ